MPIIDLTSALTFAEGGTAQFVDANMIVSGGGTYTEGYVEFAVDASTADDNFVLTSAANVDAIGAISVEDGDVFLGNGAGRDRIGSIDGTFDGQDGQPLRILFSSPLPNSGFEEGEDNWDIRDERYGDSGTELNLDNLTISLANDSDYSGGSGTTNTQDPNGAFTYDGSVNSGDGVDGTKALYLGSSGGIVAGDQDPGGGFQQDGYGSIHGPYATSEVISVQAGDSISLDFKAVGSGDDYEVFGFLRRVDGDGDFISNDVNDTANNINLFAQRGNDTGGYVSISEDSLPPGNYRFEFVGGTYDATGGYAVGNNLYVDNIRLISSTTVRDGVVQTIGRQVTYQNEGDDAPLSRQITVTTVDANGASDSDGAVLTFVPENDSPTIASLSSAIDEDDVPAGDTVATLVSMAFDDPDNAFSPTDSLAGIVVTGNVGTADQGEWQYSSNGSDWHAIGAVSAEAGLLLEASASLRFLPAEDWNGTPGSLTVHAVDGTYAGGFSAGPTRTVFDTTVDDPVTSPVSDAGAAVSMTVNAVNDVAVFTSAPLDLTIADTDAQDDPAPLTGTITASDLHDGAPNEGGTLTFGLVGGTSNDATSSVATPYGILTIDEASGAYSYDVDGRMLNSLPLGTDRLETFTMTVSDGQGGTGLQTMTVNLTGANDTPVPSSAPVAIGAVEDEGVAFALPAGLFANPDAAPLTYGAALAGGDPLPSWLVFDPEAGSFAGTPPRDYNGDLSLLVTATGGGGLSAQKTITLSIAAVEDPFVAASEPAEPAGLLRGRPFEVPLPDGLFPNPDGDVLSYAATLADGGALPGWMAIDPASGTVTGAPGPGDAIPAGVLVTATDEGGRSAVGAVPFSVTDAPAPEVTEVPLAPAAALEDAPFALALPAGLFAPGVGATTVTADGGPGTPLPGWLRFDAATMTLAGTPPADFFGEVPIRLLAADADGNTVERTFVQVFEGVPDAPVVTAARAAFAVGDGAGSRVDLSAHASDPDGEALVLVAAGSDVPVHLRPLALSSGATLSLEGDGFLAYTPSAAMERLAGAANGVAPETFTEEVELQVRNGTGGEVVDTMTLTFTVEGDASNDDWVFGAVDADALFGRAGDDRLLGFDGDDTLVGNGGADRLNGGSGDDALRGHRGADSLFGGAGDDLLMGGRGDDRLGGGTGDDVLRGAQGNDALWGRAGEDLLRGGAGDDALAGGRGDDRLIGGAGDDALAGGLGADAFVFTGAFGTDTVADWGRGADAIDLRRADTSFDALDIRQDGDDAVIALAGADARGTIVLQDTDAGTLEASDFLF